MDNGVRILELARDVQALVEYQPAHEQRRLHNIVFSNCARESGEVVSTFRQSTDLPADASRSGGNDSASPRKNETFAAYRSAGGMERFRNDTYYRTADPAMRLIATAGTLAVWRHEGRGPAYQPVD